MHYARRHSIAKWDLREQYGLLAALIRILLFHVARSQIEHLRFGTAKVDWWAKLGIHINDSLSSCTCIQSDKLLRTW